jgi:hypothetical protein
VTEFQSGNRRSIRVGATLIALVSAAALAAFLAGSAVAASTHPYVATYTTGAKCAAEDIATDAEGNYYVACTAKGLNNKFGSIRKFDPNGNPLPWTGSASYISGNELTENPVSSRGGGGEWGYVNMIDVDTSNSIRKGYVYVFDYWGTGSVDVFDPAGEYVTTLGSEWANGSPSGVGVDDKGYVYLVYESFWGGHVTKFDPVNYNELERIQPSREESPQYGPCCVRIRPDTDGGVWVGWGSAFFDMNSVAKYENYEFSTNTHIKYGERQSIVVSHQSPYLNEKFEIENFPNFHCPEFQNKPGFSGGICSLESNGYDVDFSNNDLYSNTGSNIVPYSEGVAGDPVHQNGPAFGSGLVQPGSSPFGGSSPSRGIAIDKQGNVFVAQGEEVVKWARGGALPNPTTKPVAVTNIGHTTAFLPGVVDPDDGGPVTSCSMVYGTTPSYGQGPVACKEATPFPDGTAKDVTVELTGLTVGQIYHYRLGAGNANGFNAYGGDRVFEAKAVLDLETKPATDVVEHSVTANGQLDPDSMATTYYYEYGASKNYGLETASQEVNGPSGTVVQTPIPLAHLQSGRVYHYRLVATNALGTTRGEDQTVRTASPPEIAGVGDENVADTSADLHATINPGGFDTTYQFEYGPTPAYGSAMPISAESIGSGNSPVEVKAHLEGLPAGTTIHYRVVATNKWGTSTSDDTTFDFRPPSCPNAHVRAETGGAYLPDCRAYELVTPGEAGAVQILPSEGLYNFANTFGGYSVSPLNFGYATSPSRFTYMGALGSVAGQDAPNSLLDVYLATRTPTGWKTTMPGLKGNETLFGFGRNCSDTQDLCADYVGPQFVPNEEGTQEKIDPSNAPYLYKADGTRLGRLPSNVNTVKGGTQWRGDQQFSGDFSAYVFSTMTKMTPDGISAAPGSVYYNDIAKKTVEVISYDKNGDPIQLEPERSQPEFDYLGELPRVTGIAAVSANGSRVLMAGLTYPSEIACGPAGCQSTKDCDVRVYPFQCPYPLATPARLYMRDVPAKVTYEVSREKEVNFVDMTRDGSKVFFISSEKFSPADKDTSADLYMWTAADDQLTLISQNGTLGNSDSCNPSWTTKCGVQQLTPELFQGSPFFDLVAHVKGIDDIIANESGDVYFFSPEDLVPGEVGGDNERNLYVWRKGQLRLVATLDPGTNIERSTISTDGSHAAFVTKSRLTAYDSEGKREAYVYDADSGALRCASCNPGGAAPTAFEELTVSESGPFMADDGRTFFTTKEGLVPQDTDRIRDVYEYVGGHPRLISSGTGERDSTGGLEVLGAFFGSMRTGLESVSRDGTDVYFSTFETLAPEDHNGSFLKIYDARVGGGFDSSPDLGPCVAADECHGAGSMPPGEAGISTGAGLGQSGNLQPAKKKLHKKKKKRRHHRRGKKGRRAGERGHRNG